MPSRRKFIQQAGAGALAAMTASLKGIAAESYVEERRLLVERSFSASDKIRVACIGMGIMGQRNAKTLLQVPGVELVAACDLYTGRLERSRELFGKDLFITQDYRELLLRRDIDAVVISTSDQWHDRISMDAMLAGKAVYCEKPVVHQIQQGWPLVRIQQQTGQLLQVGSQRVSSVAYAKAKELYKAGEIGQLNCIEASFDRHTALGAWQYTMPPDASTDTIAWERYFREGKVPAFDPKLFFWWRNYREYGTGVAGDLFVHLLSGIHFLTGSKGPSRVFATGDLGYWKDGRDVPDVMTAVMEYKACNEHPAFQLLLKVNLASGAEKVESGKVKIYGTEGMIDFGWNDFTLYRNRFSTAPGIGGWDALDTYPLSLQEKIRLDYDRKYAGSQVKDLPSVRFTAPDGYDDRFDHFIHFFSSIREKKPVVEDVAFGFRAAAPCLACNESYFQGKVIGWDGGLMKLTS